MWHYVYVYIIYFSHSTFCAVYTFRAPKLSIEHDKLASCHTYRLFFCLVNAGMLANLIGVSNCSCCDFMNAKVLSCMKTDFLLCCPPLTSGSWSFHVFISYGSWFLRGGSDIDIQIMAGYSQSSLSSSHSGVLMLRDVCYSKKLLWSDLKATTICEYKDKNVGYSSLILCPLSKQIVVDLFLTTLQILDVRSWLDPQSKTCFLLC